MLRLLPVAAACVAACLLVACDDDDNDSTSVPPTSPTVSSYVGTTDAIAAWADPATRSFDGPDVGTYAGKRQFMRGTIDALSGTDVGVQAGVQVWKGDDGHVWAVDLASDGLPVSVQLSSETAATIDDACTLNGLQGGTTYDYQGVVFNADLVTPTNSAYVYRLPGADGVCGTADDVVHLVRTGMSATDTPVVASLMPASVVNDASGAITGYVGKSGATLVETDANLANPVVVGTFGSTLQVASPLPVGLTTGYPTGRLWVVDGNIVHVDYAAHTTSAPLYTIPNWSATDERIVTAASPTTLYFAVNTPADGLTAAFSTIYAMPADGSAAPVVASVQSGAVRQLEFPVGGTAVVAGVVDPDLGGYRVVAIAGDQVDGSAGTTIANFPANGAAASPRPRARCSGRRGPSRVRAASRRAPGRPPASARSTACR